jgi:hypothetical protein
MGGSNQFGWVVGVVDGGFYILHCGVLDGHMLHC